MSRVGGCSIVLTPKSVADKSRQFVLAKLNVLQVRDIQRSRTGGTQSGWGGRDMGCRVQGSIVGPKWGPEADWTFIGIVRSPAALEVMGRDL